jgi:glyoxylase-like metal-dependent hydrolase (beta-lactamase superfamily II)
VNAAKDWPRNDVRIVSNQGFHSNTYLLKIGDDSACVVVDPGLDREAIEQDIAVCNWQPQAVLCTHGHFDHLGSAAWVQSTYQVPVYLCAADLKLARLSNFMLAAFNLNRRIDLPDFQLVNEGDAVVECDGQSFVFHSLPGHSPGSAGIAVNDLLFSGDSLYARGTALSRLPGEDHAVLRASLDRLFTWVGDGVRVLPGHGGSATIEDIRSNNKELRAFMAAPA